MSKRKKLLEKAFNNPNGLRISEFETLLENCDWKRDRQNGSHQIWYSPKKYPLSVQDIAGKAKGYQVKQFLDRYNKENNSTHA